MSTIPTVGSNSDSGSTSSSSSSTSAALEDPLAQKDTFLKLMIAQMKYQDPMNPTDSSQFLGELAQFTTLEQMTYIRQGVEEISDTLQTATATTDSTQETN